MKISIATSLVLFCVLLDSVNESYCLSAELDFDPPFYSKILFPAETGIESNSSHTFESQRSWSERQFANVRPHSHLVQIGGELNDFEFERTGHQIPGSLEDEPACVKLTPCYDRSQLELFAGLEGSKQPQDFGVNAHFGTRLHANFGFQLFDDSGLGFQIGSAINMTDHAVRVTSKVDGASSRTQSFTTAGFFQRNGNFSWAAVIDYLYQNDYSAVSMSQIRIQGGFNLNETQELGVFFMFPTNSANANWAGIPVNLDPLAQGALFFRQTWDHSAETTLWLGAAEGHGQANAALGDSSDTNVQIMFGSDLHVPLNDYVALFGQANFIMPTDTGTVDAYLGFAIYPGGNARGWRKQKFSPVLPVANNTSFAVDLHR